MIRNLTIFAGLAATGVAQAALLGGVMRENVDGSAVVTGALGSAHTVFDMYIQFDEADDILISIGNSAFTSAGDFYQNAFVGNFSTSVSPALIAAFPEVEYDTFVGIGGPYFSGAAFGGGTDPDFAITNNTVAGGWFGQPATINGEIVFPGTSEFNSDLGVYEVFAGRFTLAGDFDSLEGVGNGSILTAALGARGQNLVFEGVLDAFWVDAQGEGENAAELSFAVPAPGAAALFGLAGLTAARRRR